jgi:hypothetical protein
MSNQNGKGDGNRTSDWEAYRRNYDEIFKKNGDSNVSSAPNTNSEQAICPYCQQHPCVGHQAASDDAETGSSGE